MIAQANTMSDSTNDAPSSSSNDNNNDSSNKGVAGRINYAKWDKVARDLVQEVDAVDAQEQEEAKKALGLGNKYARSQAEAEERQKSKQVRKTKKTLEKYQKRELQLRENLVGLLGPVVEGEPSASAATHKVVRITRDLIDAGKRVVNICDTSGTSPALKDTVVLTQDLSLLESKMAVNSMAKSFAGDAENDVPQNQQQQTSVFGLIKVFVVNVHNCTILIKCKIISGSMELHNCSNVRVCIEGPEATVATIQADLSENIQIEFRDAPSGKNTSTAAAGSSKMMYWGDDKDDRIFHAGVKNLNVKIVRDDFVESELVVDYLKDGAVAIGNATPEEFQFVTSCVEGKLVTEQVVRTGQSTGKNVRAMTPREVEEEKKRRERAAELALAMAEDMIQVKDKDGNVLAKKTEPTTVAAVDDNDDVVEEVYGSMSTAEIKEIVDECEQNKARGNEAFGAGEYGQAILLYSLALDKADELPDQKLFPRDVLYSNRAACFLKLGQHEKAVEDTDRALECNSLNVKATFRKGLALHAMGRYREAAPILAEAYKIEPKNKQIQQALQFCEVRLQQEMRKLHEAG